MLSPQASAMGRSLAIVAGLPTSSRSTSRMSISYLTPNTVCLSTPVSVCPFAYPHDMGERDIRRVLADNVRRLIAHHAKKDLDPGKPLALVNALKDKAKITMGTAQRVLEGKTSIGISIIDKIAREFKLRAYQLLVPDLDPSTPQWLPTTPEEKRVYRVAQLAVSSLGQDQEPETDEPVTAGGSADGGTAHSRHAGQGSRSRPRTRK